MYSYVSFVFGEIFHLRERDRSRPEPSVCGRKRENECARGREIEIDERARDSVASAVLEPETTTMVYVSYPTYVLAVR